MTWMRACTTTAAFRRILPLLVLPFMSALPGVARAQVKVDWTKHHDHEEVTRLVHAWAKAYPDLVSLESLGKSHQGRDLWLLTLTNEKTGLASEKPALWIDGHSDGGEVISKEVALYLIQHLLEKYGSDEQATRLLNTRTLYIEPNANPDPGEQLIQRPVASTIQGVSRGGYLYPQDDDGDGRVDEDPPEDIDGDGRVLSMRVEDPDGGWRRHPQDPRLLVRRLPEDGPDAGPFYRYFDTEGIDNDADGRINEDWLGGFDSNRVYPGNWQPEWRQKGAPAYPLFFPEPRAIVDAVLARPNIAALISLHTSGVFPGGTLWPPPASQFPQDFPGYDMRALYPTFGRKYEEIMRREGYPYSAATAANVREREPRGNLPGTLIDWGLINMGILSWTPEIWARGAYDYDGNGSISDLESMRWNEEEWDGKLFAAWKKAAHPALGTVEVGGWRNDVDAHGLTPPEGAVYLAEQIRPWLLYVMESLPQVALANVRSEAVGTDLYRVTATVKNTGFLDTPSTEHGATLVAERGLETDQVSYVPLVAGVSASISVAEGEVVGEARREIGHLKGVLPGERFRTISRTWPQEATVSWVVRGKSGTKVTIKAGAPRAGTATRTITLGTPVAAQ